MSFSSAKILFLKKSFFCCAWDGLFFIQIVLEVLGHMVKRWNLIGPPVNVMNTDWCIEVRAV